MADTVAVDYFRDGVDIRTTANGYIVQPGRYIRDGQYLDWQQCYVFNTVADLAAWMKTRYKAHG